MFRLGARRCVRMQSVLATPFGALRARAALPTTPLSVASAPRSFSPLKNTFAALRSYSSEAEATSAPADAPHEVTTFEELRQYNIRPQLIEAVVKGMGYTTMTPVQAQTIVPAMKGTDIVAQAKTGTGKTLAFLLPLFQRMLDADPSLGDRSSKYDASSEDIRGIVLSPTRELAIQIAEEAKNLAKKTGIVVQVAVGGTNKKEMLRKTQREGCHLLVATPGRLYDLLTDPSARIGAPKLSALILDEADRMLDVGFERELHNIMDILPPPERNSRQTMLVSATIPENVISLARKMVRQDDFEFVQTIGENEGLTHERVPQHLVPLKSWSNMFPTLFTLIDNEVARIRETPGAAPFKAIVYLNTTAATVLAADFAMTRKRMSDRDSPLNTLYIRAIHSQLRQNSRQNAADGFKDCKSGILFSSDVTARGMDFPNVTHVIQLDIPKDRESYIHRIGRTARQDKDGQAWLLLPDSSTRTARKLLSGLPLIPNESLADVADVDVTQSENLPAVYEEMKEIAARAPQDQIQQFFLSLMGAALNKQEVAEETSDAVIHTFGLPAPSVGAMFARKVGLRASSRLQVSHDGGRFGQRRDDSRDQDRGMSRDRGMGRDAFDSMRSRIRSDSGRGGFDRGRGGFDRSSGRGGFDRNSSRGGFDRNSRDRSSSDSRW